eukprot:767897-Hanusia_phi.AAC.1
MEWKEGRGRGAEGGREGQGQRAENEVKDSSIYVPSPSSPTTGSHLSALRMHAARQARAAFSPPLLAP